MSIVAKRVYVPLGTEVGLRLGDIVLDGYPALRPLRGTALQFLANVRCGQTAGWIKMPLGMEVCFGPGDFMFDGDPAPPEKKAQPPSNFWLMSIVVKQPDGSRCHLVQR